MIDFNNELRNIFLIGIRMGQANPKQDANKLAKTLLAISKMAAKGENILQRLFEDREDA